MLKKAVAILLSAVIVVISIPVVSADGVSARAYVLMDALNGSIISSKNADEHLAMASTTKIMTALLLIEAENPEQQVTVTADAIKVEGTSMGLRENDVLTRLDLCYGMMLSSGNDSANVTAIHLSGSYSKFAEKMNEKAKVLGMNNTHFVTPSGLDDEKHYTSAKDMAILTRYALQNPLFLEICSTKSKTLNFSDKTVTLSNHNKLLRICDGCIGVKTGFTSKAGRCLVSAAERNGRRLICVTLRDPNDWDDHINLYNSAFSRMKSTKIKPDIPSKVPLVGGMKDFIEIRCDELEFTCLSEQFDKIICKTDIPKFIYAPVEIGDCIGKTEIYLDNIKIGERKIVAVTSSDYIVPTERQKPKFIKCLYRLIKI